MGIDARIRVVLAGMEFPGGEARIYALMVKAVLGSQPEPAFRVADGFDDVEDGRRWVREAFREAGSWRAMRRFGWWERARGLTLGRFGHWKEEAERSVEVGAPPVRALWYHWMLLLGERALGVAADRELLKRLWGRGFSEQQGDGRLLRWDAEGAIDGLVYDELAGIHAGYNSAKVMGDAAMMEQVGRVVRWHVENTQPDNTTNEPWGLAGFAALDETGTFAEQQLQDAVVQLRNGAVVAGRVPVAVGLLADAVMTMENGGDV